MEWKSICGYRDVEKEEVKGDQIVNYTLITFKLYLKYEVGGSKCLSRGV